MTKMMKLLPPLASLALLLSACSSEDTTSSTLGASTKPDTVATTTTTATDFVWEEVSLLALGNDDVPVGRYGKELLEKMGLWEELQGKISYASNVKEVLSQVELGSVDCGIVYRTDANSSSQVEIVETLDSSLLENPVIYPACSIQSSENLSQAEDFLEFLTTDVAQEIFSASGFTVLGEAGTWEEAEVEDCTLTIFAAASLTEAITALCDRYEQRYEGVEFLLSFDSSGTLATQIEFGATADLFLSASTTEMDRLELGGYLEESHRIALLENEIVLIVGK